MSQKVTKTLTSYQLIIIIMIIFISKTGGIFSQRGSYHVPNIQYNLADLTVSKRPGTSYQIESYFAVVNHLYPLFSFAKLVET